MIDICKKIRTCKHKAVFVSGSLFCGLFERGKCNKRAVAYNKKHGKTIATYNLKITAKKGD